MVWILHLKGFGFDFVFLIGNFGVQVFGCWVLDFQRMIWHLGLRILDFSFQSSNLQQIWEFGFWISYFRLRLFDFGFLDLRLSLWIFHFGFWISDFSLWILDFNAGFWDLDFRFFVVCKNAARSTLA